MKHNRHSHQQGQKVEAGARLAMGDGLNQTPKSPTGQGPAGGQSGNHPEAKGTPENGKQSEGPIIDAEVVEEKTAV